MHICDFNIFVYVIENISTMACKKLSNYLQYNFIIKIEFLPAVALWIIVSHALLEVSPDSFEIAVQEDSAASFADALLEAFFAVALNLAILNSSMFEYRVIHPIDWFGQLDLMQKCYQPPWKQLVAARYVETSKGVLHFFEGR